jgi:hypothetical protein
MVGRLWELCAGVRCTAAESAAYRSYWDGQKRALAGLCRYLGRETGALQPCQTCRGRVELKVFRCEHPAHASQPTTTYRDCRFCGDFSPVTQRVEDES